MFGTIKEQQFSKNNRNDFFLQFQRNFLKRINTNRPIVKRDYNNFIFQKGLQKQKPVNHSFSIEEILNNDKNNFINNEEIKKIIYNCKKHFQRNHSICFPEKSNLPKIDINNSFNVRKKTEYIKEKRMKLTNRLNSNTSKKVIRNQSQSAILSKSQKKRLLKLNSGIQIKGFYCRTRPGESNFSLSALTKRMDNNHNLNNHQISLKKNKKNNLSTYIAKFECKSKVLGNISLFGILKGNGENGYQISRLVKNHLISYFEKSPDIQASINKDNYYTILSNAYLETQQYIKDSISKKMDCNFSGTTCLLLIFPNNSTHKVYCANSGNSKCVLYSLTSNIPLSYQHYPIIFSEKERILKNGGFYFNDIGNSSTSNLIFKKEGIDINGFNISRILGNFFWNDIGVIPDPEIIECNLNKEDTKFIILGSDSLWKYLTNELVGEIVLKYYEENNLFGACKELEETARLKWRKYGKEIDDMTIIVIFFHWKKFKS